MPDCFFTEKSKKPADKALESALGSAAPIWNGFIEYFTENHGPISSEWKFMKSGWVLISKRKTRTVCYLFPAEGFFTVAFVLGEKAVAVMRETKLPKRIMDAMEEAKPYAEGRGFYVKAAKPADLAHLRTLVTIKMEN
jgi:hypothetical protein